MSQTLPYTFKDIPLFLLLKGDNKIFPEDETHLFFLYVLFHGIIGDHLEDQQDVTSVVFDLGPLVGLQYVLQNKRVDVETVSCLLHDLQIVKTINIDPGHRWLVLEWEHI